jgi:hypothetical protein
MQVDKVKSLDNVLLRDYRNKERGRMDRRSDGEVAHGHCWATESVGGRGVAAGVVVFAG